MCRRAAGEQSRDRAEGKSEWKPVRGGASMVSFCTGGAGLVDSEARG